MICGLFFTSEVSKKNMQFNFSSHNFIVNRNFSQWCKKRFEQILFLKKYQVESTLDVKSWLGVFFHSWKNTTIQNFCLKNSYIFSMDFLHFIANTCHQLFLFHFMTIVQQFQFIYIPTTYIEMYVLCFSMFPCGGNCWVVWQ